MFEFTKILDSIPKLPFLNFLPFVVMLLSGSILSMGTSTADWLSLRDHRLTIGVVFLVSLALLLAQLCHLIWQWMSGKILDRNASSIRDKRLHKLTPGEKRLLQEFLDADSRALLQSHEANAVVSLVASGILTEAPGGAKGFPLSRSFIMVEWAWNYLSTHRSLLIAEDHPKQQPKISSAGTAS